ncbi:MAG TPA: hypothetical protein VHZ25_05885 [Acidobacteriaceae bacterium]|jgi:hypothetical protein|nr:hypothetical protein [Acidobacteriaceae bacterium]
MLHRARLAFAFIFTLAVLPLPAQMQMQMGPPQTFVEAIETHTTSGTSAEPDSTPAPMLMTMRGSWMLMLHGNGFLADTQQTSPRGGDKLFSTNWVMPMAQRRSGPGQFTVRTMLSLEPATVTGRQYPLLFQQGETAYGLPIADGQHPHDFVMELGALYDLHLGEHNLLSLYAAPVGDPAIGPTAYPHRASAIESPVGTLGHHQEDSTHISDDVVTLGVTHDWLRLEASGFHGREPNEHRWQVQQGAIDSWSARLTLQPGKNWSGQYSWGRLHSPEALFPTSNQDRRTASVMYNRALGQTSTGGGMSSDDKRTGNWATTIAWGRTRDLPDNLIENSYLLESTVRFHARNYAFTRIENVDRTNELLLGERPLPPNFQEAAAGRVQACTFGYDRDIGHLPHLATALGAQVTAYHSGALLEPVYGSDPMGVAVFLRLRPVGPGK